MQETKITGCCWAFKASAARGDDARGKKSSGSNTRKQVTSSPFTTTSTYARLSSSPPAPKPVLTFSSESQVIGVIYGRDSKALCTAWSLQSSQTSHRRRTCTACTPIMVCFLTRALIAWLSSPCVSLLSKNARMKSCIVYTMTPSERSRCCIRDPHARCRSMRRKWTLMRLLQPFIREDRIVRTRGGGSFQEARRASCLGLLSKRRRMKLLFCMPLMLRSLGLTGR